MPALYANLGPWVWTDDAEGGARWEPPAGTVGLLDLRGPAVCSIAGKGGEGVGLFLTADAPLKDPYVALNDGSALADSQLDGKLLDLWRASLGLEAKGLSETVTRLSDVLLKSFWELGDPEGFSRFLPATATHAGDLELFLGGLVGRRKFTGPDDPAWPPVQSMLQAGYKSLVEQTQEAASLHVRELPQRVLSTWCAKYAVPLADARLFIPADMPVVEAKPPQTAYSDDFNRAALGADWTAVTGAGWTIYNSTVLRNANNSSSPCVRYEHDLSSSDHYAQLLNKGGSDGNRGQGAAVRFASAAATFYWAVTRTTSTGANLYKVVAGTSTSLANVASGKPTNKVNRVDADGSTITFTYDGVQVFQITDTAITSGTRCGVCTTGNGAGNYANGDDWSCEDLAAPPAGHTPYSVLLSRRRRAA